MLSASTTAFPASTARRPARRTASGRFLAPGRGNRQQNQRFSRRSCRGTESLDYMHARFYNPQVGRFLSVDKVPSLPIRPQTWNRYAYVSNNPLAYNDPDGNRQNPVTGGRGVAPPAYGVKGALRKSPSNQDVGRFGNTRKYASGAPRFHPGIDINAPTAGTPLLAPEDGKIIRMSRGPQAGNRVDIETSSGETVILVHLDSFTSGIKVGDTVGEGDVVGESGTTGNQPDPGDSDYDAKQEHVHMTVLDSSGNRVDPEAWLNDPAAPPPK